MKKTLRLMGLCALAVLALAGCKKNEQNGNMTFKAIISQLNSDAKTEIGAGNWLVWSEGDQIKVYTADKTEANAANFTLATGAGTTEATFNGTLEASESYTAIYPANNVDVNTDGNIEFQLSGTQTYVGGNFTTDLYPMYATSTNGNFTFYSPCGILALQLKGTATIGSIELTDSTHMDLAGTFELTGTDVNFHDTHSTLGILMDFGANGLTLDANTATLVYFVVPEGAFAGGFKAEVKGTDGNRIVLLETSTPNTITAETIHLMPEVAGVNGSTVPEGALPGKFTVDNTGRQIYFAQGNLQYIGSAGTPYWKFADNQWDYLGTTTGQNSTNQNVDRDLFGWGTWTGSATNPANTSSNNSDYSWDNSDFVKTLQNGSGTWRTLNNDEWGYLFYLRASGATVTTTSGTTNDARYTEATINTDGTGVNGIILFPDGVTIASGEATSWGDINLPSAYGTTCTTAQWAALEAKGCVFLPAAGRRHNSTWNTYATTVQINGGYYWSSTPDGSDYACSMYFYSGYVNPQTNDCHRFIGRSVRLVQDYEGNGGGTGGGGNPGAGLNGMQTGSSHGW